MWTEVDGVERELACIEGTVDAVIYQNKENGYTVLKLEIGEGGGLYARRCARRGSDRPGELDAPRLLRRPV